MQPIQPAVRADQLFDAQRIYTGRVKVLILRDAERGATFVRVDGERVALEIFQGAHHLFLREKFGDRVAVIQRSELEDMRGFFGDAESMKGYIDGQVRTDERMRNAIKRDSDRPHGGDVFTGYAIVDKVSNKIIGRMGIGSGYKPGESQFGLMIAHGHRGQGKGKEAAYLGAALSAVFASQGYPVNGKSIEWFTATTRDSNQDSIRLMTSLGMKKLRPLTAKENHGRSESGSLYGIEATTANADKIMSQLFVHKPIVEIQTIGNSYSHY